MLKNSLHDQFDICLPSLRSYISMLNIAAVWIIKPSGGSISGPGPYIFSNVTTPIGQVQPSSEPTGTGRYDINVLLVSQSNTYNLYYHTEDKQSALLTSVSL